MSRYRAVEGELEDELAHELADEFEDEWEGLVREWEDEDEDFYEFEDELEDECEDEFDSEFEAELEDLVRELEEECENEFEYEDELEDEFEALVRELEDEFEFEAAYEDFANPARRIYPDAELMANLAFQAEQAETEDEVEGFLAPLVSLAARGLPRLAPLIRSQAPKLVRGIGMVGRKLWNSGASRLIRRMPAILKRTVGKLSSKVRDAGRRVNNRLWGPFRLTPGSVASSVLGALASTGASKLFPEKKKPTRQARKRRATQRSTAKRTARTQPARRRRTTRQVPTARRRRRRHSQSRARRG